MLLIDALFRFTGIGALFLIGIIAWRDLRHWRSCVFLVLSCVSISALFLGYAPDPFRLPDILYYPLRILDVPHLIFVWLFALSLYQKDFRLKAQHAIIGLAYCIPIFWIRLSGFGVFESTPVWLVTYVSLTSLVLVGHLIYSTLKDWSDDLVVKRRRSRFYFVLVVIFVAVVAAVSEPFLIGKGWMSSQTFKILSIWPAIALGAVWLLRGDRDAVDFSEKRTEKKALSPEDETLKRKLEHTMKDEGAFKEPNMNIVTLSARLGVTQHRLRALINATLGHQNFSSYVNELRVAEVKKLLADKTRRHLPIQTLALDCGFKSLSPFNRAFKLSEGITPTEYRKQYMNAD